MSILKAGQKLASYFGRGSTGRKIASSAGMDAAVGIGFEQILPRALGTTPEATIPESVIRQGVASAVGTPFSMGLQKLGVPGSVSNLAGQIAGQPFGQAAAQAILPGNQAYPLGIDPEPAEAGHANYGQLMAAQNVEAAQERLRYERALSLAYARNYKAPSFIQHNTYSDPIKETENTLMKVFGRSTPYG